MFGRVAERVTGVPQFLARICLIESKTCEDNNEKREETNMFGNFRERNLKEAVFFGALDGNKWNPTKNCENRDKETK